MSTVTAAEPKKTGGWLGTVERIGNKVPHPVLMFLYLIIGVIVLSAILAWMGVSVTEEIAVLESFLPKTLSVDEIVAALAAVADPIKAAGNDGQATGVAMKHLKSTSALVNGKDVSEAVKKIRS